MHLKAALSKKYLNTALSKKMHFKKTFQNCSLKVFQKHTSNCPLNVAPSKNAFQNCYKLSIGNKNKKTLDM